jgi:HAD superfamily hydrolase (TIGR01450 family)
MDKHFSNIKLFAFDLDGTLYVGEKAVPGAVELIRYLRDKYRVVYFTNNSTKTASQTQEKLKGLGFECELKEIYTSSSAAAVYLKEAQINNLYVIGSPSFRNEIASQGLKVVNHASADNLVVGLDSDFNYKKIADALSVLLKGGKFIACNEDRAFPAGENKFLPGCGTMVGAIAAAAGRQPDYVVGKPNTYILSKIAGDYHAEPCEIVVVGDSYESDIKMALNYNCQAILVGNNDSIFQNNVLLVEDLHVLLQKIRREIK